MVIKAYCGYINNDDKLKLSASGGIATSMAEKVVEDGGVVYGAAYYPIGSFEDAAYIRVATVEEVFLLRTSKYIKATLSKELMDLIVEDLKLEKKVLFIGVPCDVMAIKNYCKKAGASDMNLFTVDLICRGPTSPAVAKEFIQFLEKKNKSKIVDFNVRYKNPYWKPPYLYAKFENGKVFTEPFYETAYGTAFLMMPENKCYICKNKGDNHVADVTIGDHWGTDSGDVGYNKFGASVALIHTQKGESLVTSLRNFNLYPTDAEQAIKSNRRYTENVKKTPEMEKFKLDFEEKGLFYAVSQSLTLKKKLINGTKSILKKLNIRE